MKYLKVKNWSEFQHYKDRNPPWIKLHRALLDDYEFARLQDASKAHLMLIWLFASQRDGSIPADPVFLKKKLGLQKEPDLKIFIDHGLLIPEQNGSDVLAESKRNAPLEEERTNTTERIRLEAGSVLAYLNEKASRDYRPVNGNIGFITARLKEGASVEDCKAVIDRKVEQWKGGDMDKFLRPATLFSATKFAQYQGETSPKVKVDL